jgi:2-methylcitrate dehydratase PrpD
MTQESLTEKLAKHVMRPVDDATRTRARLHLLDWLGCVAGARGSNARGASAGVSNVSTRSALFGNMLEMDDIHRIAILHPAPVIWASAMMQPRSDMTRLLDGAVRGYEAMIIVGETFDSHHYSRWHPTATAGVFGSTMVTANYFSMTQTQLVWGFGNAGSVAGGLWNMRHEDVMTKQWHVFHAVNTGANAALSAMYGLTGPRFILEGPQGLYEAMCEMPKPMTFSQQWRIHDVSFKPWGACRHAHPAIDAALELKIRLGVLDGEILVETYGDAIVFCDRPEPQSSLDAKFSLQHAVAIVVQKGVPELADFEPDSIAAFAHTRARVTVKEAEDISLRYPRHYGARVTCSGESVELVDTLGDPERPMMEQHIIDKACALIAWGGLSKGEGSRAVDIALNGTDASAVHDMLTDWLS